MIVIDTNVIAYLLIDGQNTDLAELVYGKDPEWLAPVLWKSEFRNVLVLHLRKNFLTVPEANTLMGKAEEMMYNRQFDVSSRRVLELAKEANCSAYDGEFVALAEEMGVRLVTWDRRTLTAFPGIAISPTEFLNGESTAS